MTVKKRALTVRAAKHVRQRSTIEQIADRVRSALYAPIDDNPLHASVDVTAAGQSIKAMIRVPVPELSVVPQEDGTSEISYQMMIAAVDDQMRETPLRAFIHRFNSPEQTSIQVLKLDVPPGHYTVSLALIDSYSLLTSYVQREVTVP